MHTRQGDWLQISTRMENDTQYSDSTASCCTARTNSQTKHKNKTEEVSRTKAALDCGIDTSSRDNIVGSNKLQYTVLDFALYYRAHWMYY